MPKTEAGNATLGVTMAHKKSASIKRIKNSTMKAISATESYNEYFCFREMMQKLFTSKTAMEWAKEIVDYACRPMTLKASDYFMDKGMAMDDAERLCKDHEVLGKAYQYAKYMIGNRRERMGLMNDLNTGIVTLGLPLYDKEWMNLFEWKAKLTQDSSANKGNITVLIERYPETSMVPVKVKDQE